MSDPSPDGRRVVVDTDTAGDDALGLLLAGRTERLALEGVTVVAGNVPFEREVENAKYALDLAGRADEVRVHEGTRRPLLKDYEHATEIHGEGGLGGLVPETGIASAAEHAVDYLRGVVREGAADGDPVSLVCLGPLTNVALALARDPGLADCLDRVWAMGGAIHTEGNVTPAAEYNFWVDPDAARLVVRHLELTLVDWGLCVRDGAFDPETLDALSAFETPYADFFETVARPVREHGEHGGEAVTFPDLLAVAVAAAPELVETATDYALDVDERAGPTRGYCVARALDGDDAVEPGSAGTSTARVVESIHEDRYREVVAATLRGDQPTAPLE